MSLRIPLALLVASLCIIAGIWLWLARPVTLSRAPIDPAQKLECVSYTPFRGAQTPLDPTLHVSAGQIAEDLKELVKITGCIRTYSVDVGLDQVPGEAAKVGLKVIQGIWLGNNRLKNSLQIDTAVALAKKYPDTIQSLVVGNEVLLRGEMTSQQVANAIREVKAAVPTIPVTYADVWEYWLRNRDLANVAGFVTVHLLPYWEDFPIPADEAVAHLNAIRRQVIAAFPGKEILIGETGWPSAGRMREGALPSPANQASFMAEVVALSKREN
ncbi:MAG TPA: beta-(1-6) glucans synthase, partial [Afipia sp.]